MADPTSYTGMRCLDGVEPSGLPVTPFDGRAP